MNSKLQPALFLPSPSWKVGGKKWPPQIPSDGELEACVVSQQKLFLVSPKSLLQGFFPSTASCSLLVIGICRIRPWANRGEKKKVPNLQEPITVPQDVLLLLSSQGCWSSSPSLAGQLGTGHFWSGFLPLSCMAKEEINTVYTNQHFLLINSSTRPFLLEIRISYPRHWSHKKNLVFRNYLLTILHKLSLFPLKVVVPRTSAASFSTSPHKHYLAHTGAWAQPAQLHTKWD